MRQRSVDHTTNCCKMKILQYNCQSFRANLDSIEFYLHKYEFDIACFSEIFLSSRTPHRKLIKLNLVKKYRPDGYGGVAIAVRKDITYKRIPFRSDYDILIIETKNLNPSIIICSIYFPPNLGICDFNNEMNRILNFFEPYNNVFLIGDFNARALAWGDSIDSNRGKHLRNIIQNSFFHSLNGGSYTYKRDTRSESGSVLDLAFSNSAISCSWAVDPIQIGGSHHFPITLEMNAISRTPKRFMAKRKLLDSLKEIECESNIHDLESKMQDEINNATYTTRTNRVPKAWWNEGLGKIHIQVPHNCS